MNNDLNLDPFLTQTIITEALKYSRWVIFGVWNVCAKHLCSTEEKNLTGLEQHEQVSPNLFLEGRCPAEFSSNLPQHTCLEVSSIPSNTLISCFRCVWLGLELNSAGHRPSRNKFGDPWTWGWANDDRIGIFVWTVSVKHDTDSAHCVCD